MALLTLGLSPYEVRIVTILQAHLKSPLHATGRPNNLARKKELAMFLSSGELVRLTTAVALGILGNNKNMADSSKAPVKNVFKVFPTEKDLTWSINIFRNPIKVGTHLTTCRCNTSRRLIPSMWCTGWVISCATSCSMLL